MRILSIFQNDTIVVKAYNNNILPNIIKQYIG